MSQPTISLAQMLRDGVRFTQLEGWMTIPELAEGLGVSYPGAVYLVLDAQVFDLATEVRLVGDRTLLVQRAAFEEYRAERAQDLAKAA